MVTMRVAGYIGSIAITAVLLSACATAKPPEAAPAPAAQTASRPAGHIYVTEQSLDTACYQEVGGVSYVEPFAAAATDPEHLQMADQLRKAAVEKYPNRVDAIINVHADDHDIGSDVLVSGEAVQLAPPSKVDCKLPDTIAAALVNFATGAKSRGLRRGATSGSGYNGPAGTTNTAADAEGSAGMDSARNIKENLRRAMVATMPGQTQVDGQSLADQAQLQQAEIKRLRKKLDQMISQRCEAADVSAAECDSMRKNAEIEQPHEVVAVASKEAGANSPSVFEIQNLIQEQSELIAKLRRQIADMNEVPHEAAGATPSN
ncbi:MAG: hypothetical protein WB999_12990 [Candidatus Binataceae bacterium]